MVGKLKILFVEDIIADAELVWREILKNKIAFEKLLVDNRKDFLEGLKTFSPDIIISDFSLPKFDGMTALQIRNKHTPLTPFILVTGSINEEVAVECMKAGADDYILKNNLSRLCPALNNSDMLKIVLRNLVSNAIKFTNNGGAININAEKNTGNVTISVSDNGIGIKPDYLAKLFDISQVLTTTVRQEKQEQD